MVMMLEKLVIKQGIDFVKITDDADFAATEDYAANDDYAVIVMTTIRIVQQVCKKGKSSYPSSCLLSWFRQHMDQVIKDHHGHCYYISS